MTTRKTIELITSLLAALLIGNAADAQETTLKTRDEIRAAVQAICPVSGLQLGDHGPPIKAKISGQEIFLCCDSCMQGKVKKEHWAKIHQNFAKAQGKCVVMDNPLPKKPKWVVVDGELLYVCCPPCIDKIKTSPAEYVQKLRKQQLAYLGSRQDAGVLANAAPNSAEQAGTDGHSPHDPLQHELTAEQIQIAIQKICPVSGLELGAHGPPIKSVVAGQTIYLCCDNCKNGKVKREHWAAIHQNFAKAQSKCFVMDNPLPKKPKWVVVKGRLIYVCCPPCIEKIKESPDVFLEKLTAAQASYLQTATEEVTAEPQNASPKTIQEVSHE